MEIRLKSDDLVSVAEAAKIIGCSRMTVYRWLRSRTVMGLEIAGLQVIPRNEVDRMKALTSTGLPSEGNPVLE